MPAFRPFRALRYAVDDLADVIAPPYDVLSEPEVDALAARSAHNVVRVDVPLHGEDRYARAADLLRRWQDEGVLVRDERPSFTIYRMRFADATGAPRDLAGVLGGLEVVDEGAGGVLPHERTTPKASTDRLDLTRATRTNLSPVWGLALARGLTELLRAPGEVLGSVQDGGVQHQVERVDDPERVAAIAAVVGADDVLIADGHHRYAVGRTYRDEVRAATGRTDTAAEETLTFVSELVPDQLSVAAIHRLYARVALPALRTALEAWFTLAPTDAAGAGHAGGDGDRRLPRPGRPGRRLADDAAPRRLRRRPGPGRRLAGDRAGRPAGRGELPARAGRDRRGRRGRHRVRGGADPAGQHRRDRADRPRGPPDAPEVHLLHPEAEDRVRPPTPGLRRSRPRRAPVTSWYAFDPVAWRAEGARAADRVRARRPLDLG